MPELPEVETVKETLRHQVVGKKIEKVLVYYEPIIDFPKVELFQKQLEEEEIKEIRRRGKWLIFEMTHYYLLSHLRMEGKYFLRENREEPMRHELVCFVFKDGKTLRYHDTRKFGRMYLIEKEQLESAKPIRNLGLEPWDKSLDSNYLKKKYERKKIPIKTALLDQSIIAGIGNIYADEILFLAHINPLKSCSLLTKKEREEIIMRTAEVLEHAIQLGGTTIRSFTSSEGVHGRFQNELFVHNQTICPICHEHIVKIKVGGRGTYYCPNCQKERKK